LPDRVPGGAQSRRSAAGNGGEAFWLNRFFAEPVKTLLARKKMLEHGGDMFEDVLQ
jgi:hypothetical protein